MPLSCHRFPRLVSIPRQHHHQEWYLRFRHDEGFLHHLLGKRPRPFSPIGILQTALFHHRFRSVIASHLNWYFQPPSWYRQHSILYTGNNTCDKTTFLQKVIDKPRYFMGNMVNYDQTYSVSPCYGYFAANGSYAFEILFVSIEIWTGCWITRFVQLLPRYTWQPRLPTSAEKDRMSNFRRLTCTQTLVTEKEKEKEFKYNTMWKRSKSKGYLNGMASFRTTWTVQYSEIMTICTNIQIKQKTRKH